MANSEIRIVKNIFAKLGAEKGGRRSVISTLERIRSQAVRLAPVDTGELANTLMWQTRLEEGGFNEAGRGPDNKASEDQKLDSPIPINGGIVGTNSDHGTYQEFGTRYQPAQPFLRPAGEIVLREGTTVEVAKRYSREEMAKEFIKRKKETEVRTS